MALIAGIDEAGYGPTLGPLLLSMVAVRLPDGVGEPDLWQLLSRSITSDTTGKSNRLVIADSKKVFQRARKDAFARLEEGVLAALTAIGPLPRTLHDLLARLSAPLASELASYPWYGPAELPLPVEASDLRIAGRAAALADDLAANRCELVQVRSLPVLEGAFNEMIERTRNKSAAHLTWTLRLLHPLWLLRGAEPVLVCLDKQGSRDLYGPVLTTACEGAVLRVLCEGADSSRYVLSDAIGSMEVRFEVGGEDRHLPTALASMTCKYVRELLMILFNRFWTARLPGLKPTAGYYTDALRFLKDLGGEPKKLGLIDRMWIRSR